MGGDKQAAVAKARVMLASGANVGQMLAAVEEPYGGSLFLLELFSLGLPVARRIGTQLAREPERVAHIRLPELEHLTRAWTLEGTFVIQGWLTDAILERFTIVEVRHRDKSKSIYARDPNPPFGPYHAGIEYRYGEGEAWGSASRSMDDVRAEVQAALVDAAWAAELRIVVDEPERFVLEFPRVNAGHHIGA